MDNLTTRDIAQLVPMSTCQCRVYLCRPEFALLDTYKKGRTIYYNGVTNKVIDRLRELIQTGKRKTKEVLLLKEQKKREEELLMASIKRCRIEQIKALPEENMYNVVVTIGTKEQKTFKYFHNGSTNVIDFVKDELKKISRFNKLEERSYFQ